MATDLGCPIIVGDGVYGQVVVTMNTMLGIAFDAFNLSKDAMQNLDHIQLDPIQVGVWFDPDNNWWHYIRPVRPTRPDMTFALDDNLVPQPPSVDVGPDPNFVAPPTFSEQPPVIPDRVGPGPLTATPPGDAPPITDVTVPPTPLFPDVPPLVDPSIPAFPTLPPFPGVRPNISFDAPTPSFTFTPEEYASALLDKTRGRISSMLDGGTGLPVDVINALRARAHAAVDVAELRAIQQTTEEYASRGWPEPSGILFHRITEVRQENRDKRNAVDRDIYINDEQIAVENIRFAVQQGVALESQLIQSFLELQRLTFEAAKFNVQLVIDVFNAMVAKANLEVQLYIADSQVWRTEVEALIEEYKGLIEGARLQGDLNQQRVAIFGEQVRAIVEEYNAAIETVKAIAQNNLVRIQAYEQTVEAYAARVKAYDSEWDAFSKQIEADLSRYRRYELATNVFANQIKIWADTNTNLIEQKRLRISDKELDITGYRARLDRLAQVIAAETARVNAIAQVYGVDGAIYRTDADVEMVASDSNAKIFSLGLEQERTRVTTGLENARLQITQATENAKIQVGALEAIAQTAGNVASGALSAMSVHAGLSSSLSQSQSCNTSFNYSIDASS
ncbi:MAG TPA: hypothetical protein VLE97_01815 [Gaiellaceae bacterium]|nr:hypothetical protein [Gaiellaceae bacterium]